MTETAPRGRRAAATVLLLAALLGAAAAGWWAAGRHDGRRLLLAPMFNLLEPCVQAPHQALADAPSSLAAWCGKGAESAAPVVEATLSGLGPKPPANPRLELGYTLPIPLLRLLQQQPDGGWAVDRPALRKLVNTLKEADRPAIVYLFSTHFGAHAPAEEALARDTRNLLTTQQGPLPVDTYYGDEVYPWNFTTTDNDITRRRLQVIDAFLEDACQLPPAARRNIRGITLLGELHHMFPGLQDNGMGHSAPYLITDYGPDSVQDFRRELKLRFRHILNLNRAAGSDFKSFAEIDPPGKDIRKQPLKRFSEHIDAYAHGVLPVAGWAHLPTGESGPPAWVRIYRNGELAGRVPVRGGRQDVLAAHPEFGTANVGWQFDLDFRRLQHGIHRLDILLEAPSGELLMLGTRRVAIMGPDQAAPTALPARPLPRHLPADGRAAWFIDGPGELSSYFYNPLAAMWHDFRGGQVVRYLAHFDRHIRHSCLADTPVYTHQILPFINPGWDRHRFEVDASLRKTGPTRTGISLYGDAAYGAGFDEWFASSGLSSYGVTEFHPLKAMSAPELGAVLERHRERGADFVSFFLEPRGLTDGRGAGANLFSFDPRASRFGGDTLYRATRETLAQPAAP